MYRVAYGKNCDKEDAGMVTLKDEEKPIRLTGVEWTKVVECGLKSMGYLQNQEIDTIMLCSCECESENCCSL